MEPIKKDMTQTEVIRQLLLKALHQQDFEGFRSILRSVGLPRDSAYVDYELLTKAIKYGCKRITSLLLDNGARVFKKPGIITPLHQAVLKVGWTSIIEQLLEKGAKVSDRNSRGDTPLHVAFARGASGQLIDLLLRKHLQNSDVNVVNRQKLSFLHIACTRPHLPVVASLMKPEYTGQLFYHQVSLRMDTFYAGYTPIHFAVAHGNHKIANFLLECDPGLIYSANTEQSSPLHLALERRDVKMIDLILAYDKAGWICTNKDGLTHFMAACLGSERTVVENYIRSAKEPSSPVSSFALVNSQVKVRDDLGGFTALHFAAEAGHADVVQALLSEGADCCATTHRGFTVHELAKENVKQSLQNHCDLFKCLKMHIAKIMPSDCNGNYANVEKTATSC